MIFLIFIIIRLKIRIDVDLIFKQFKEFYFKMGFGLALLTLIIFFRSLLDYYKVKIKHSSRRKTAEKS